VEGTVETTGQNTFFGKTAAMLQSVDSSGGSLQTLLLQVSLSPPPPLSFSPPPPLSPSLSLSVSRPPCSRASTALATASRPY
jgi:hypothetical protein